MLVKSTDQLLAEVRLRGVRLWAEEGRLRCSAPKGALGPDLQADLASRKAEILQLLLGSRPEPLHPADSLSPAPRGVPLPLSFGQERLWVLQRMEPGNAAYNLSMPVLFPQGLGLDTVRNCLAEVVSRHEVLRSRFPLQDGGPVLWVETPLPWDLEVLDLTTAAPGDLDAAVRRLAQEGLAKPFDLACAPVWRGRVLRLPDGSLLLLLVLHHIVADGWSLELLRGEFEALIRAALNGGRAELAALTVQYADYALWQRNALRGERLERELAYWRQQLKGAPGFLAMPTDFPRPPVQTFRGATATFCIGAPLTRSVRAFAQAEGASVFMVVLAAFNVLLSRYAGQRDIVVGTSIVNRGRIELEPLVGFFVNTQALRSEVDGAECFRDLLGRVRSTVLDALAHQDLPFEKLVEELKPQRNLSYSPVFQVMFTLQTVPQGAGPGAAGDGAMFHVDAHTAKFDLDLFVFDTGDQLKCKLEYRTDLFEPGRIARLTGHLECLLQDAVTRPDRPLRRLRLLTAAEQHQQLHAWNPPAAGRLDLPGLPRAFESVAARLPDAVALVHGVERLCYRELNERSNRLARHLRRLGVGAEVCVGICLERSPEMVAGLLAILKAGGAYVPLDPGYPPDRLAFMVAQARLPLMLTQRRLVEKLPAGAGRVIALDDPDGDWAREGPEDLDDAVHGESLAYVMFTSGSTGRPKGIMITHAGLMNYLVWCVKHYELDQGNGALVHSSISFDLTITGLFGPLLAGTAVHLLEGDQVLDAVGRVLGERPSFSLVKITPAHLELVSQQLRPEQAGGAARAFIIGGEQLPAESLRFWRENAPGTRLINEYGPTETVVGCCIHEVAPEDRSTGPVPIGRPIDHTQLYVLDGNLETLPAGVPGELFIGGAGLARGYLERPDLTAARFLPNPFSAVPGERMYRTGDLALWDARGVLHCLGRTDDQVKIRGYRVELGEIETALKGHPRILDAVVAMKEFSPGDRRLVAYLLCRAPGAIEVKALREFLGQEMPTYMVPAAFVFLPEFPLTPNGKVDRQALPLPDAGRPDAAAGAAAPQSDVELQVAGVWKEVLGLSQVGVQDNFFDLGGHSLLLVKVQARLRDLFPVEIPLVEMFRHPTIEALAQRLGRPGAAGFLDAVEQRARRQQEALTARRGAPRDRREEPALLHAPGGEGDEVLR